MALKGINNDLLGLTVKLRFIILPIVNPNNLVEYFTILA